jgi:hypothetical protein
VTARNRAGYEALVRAAAGLADCPSGLRDNAGKVLAYFDAKGRPIATRPPEDGLVERGSGDSASGGTVWLERQDGAQPLDEMLLERMAVAADIILDRRHGNAGPVRDDPLANIRSRDLDKVDAARVLGLTGEVFHGFDTTMPTALISQRARADYATALRRQAHRGSATDPR